ncbi:MAG: sodium-translocating pyrophosphatase [Kiritimatiellae bacterium]|nr:sodium-translocating pyrophosphatase [Kiritimatiellia bacterium]
MRLNTLHIGCLSFALLTCSGFPALADAADTAQRHLPGWWWLVPLAGLSALATAFHFYRAIMAAPEGNDRMKEIAGYVREGAYAYLHRQYTVVAIVFIALALIFSYMAFVLHVQHYLLPFAFLTGGFYSGLAGFIGMKTATAASSRTAQGASESLNRGLTIAFRAGAVMGLTVVGLALLDMAIWFLYLYCFHHHVFGGDPMSLETITVVMICCVMGASTQALFSRVGGGIFTKAADVGADLVGKVESGMPEDDPRNPATIADNVGDNVGDVAGMGADLYESYAGSILATAALGVAAASIRGLPVMDTFSYLAAPMLLAAIGIFLSIAGIYVVRTSEDATMSKLLAALNRGIYLSSILIVVASFFLIKLLALPMGVFWSILVGIILGIVIGKGSEWATSSDFSPTRFIVKQAQTGPATVIIGGIAEGMFSTWIPVVAVSAGMLLAFGLNGGFDMLLSGLYGVGIAAVGMLSTLGITLATDAYGPIADNAGGNAEMSGLPEEVRARTDALDALGNTTAAIGKGFAIGSAALTALALLASYVEQVRVSIHREAAVAYEAPANGQDYALKDMANGKYAVYLPGSSGTRQENQLYTLSAFEGHNDYTIRIAGPTGEPLNLVVNTYGGRVADLAAIDLNGQPLAGRKAGLNDFMNYYGATLINPKVLVGVFLGVLLVFVFSALTMKAVGRAANAMVQEVRRQFKEKPGIMDGSEKPDYACCVGISTRSAQREMVLPSLLAIAVPVATGLVLNVSGVLGLLVGGLTAGFCMAVFMANAGGAWDNAKKFIESGQEGGKGSPAHKASVVGDTVGDPFKDTCGPSLNILIKLMSMVSIVFAGLIVKYAPEIGTFLGLGGR